MEIKVYGFFLLNNSAIISEGLILTGGYVYVCVYIYIYVYVYMYVCIYIYSLGTGLPDYPKFRCQL